MKRIALFVLFFVCCLSTTWGQRKLHYKDVTTELNVFSGKDDEAGMVITCPKSIALTFESSHDKMVDVYQTEEKGENKVYYIRLKVGRKYSGRKITIITSDFNPLTFDGDLSPKQLKQYELYDPDAAFVYGCYYEYRKRGTDYFQKAMYAEAKEVYSIAKECSDCPQDSDLDERIASIDSIDIYMKRAAKMQDMLNFKEAANYYLKVLLLNPKDEAAVAKRLEMENKYTSDCTRYVEMAETYYNDGDYQKSLELYKKVVDLNCFNSVVASERAAYIQNKINHRRQRSRVFTYQWGQHTPVILSMGSYKNHKVGGYFTLGFHPDVFNAARKDYDETKDFEAAASFGWNGRPIKKVPAWIFGGIGYTMNGQFLPKGQKASINTLGDGVDPVDPAEPVEPAEQDMKFKAYHSVCPELGVLVKIKFFVLRYTFQYRFAVDKKYKDEIEKTQHSIGFGFCW